jgi:hypothetical protein
MLTGSRNRLTHLSGISVRLGTVNRLVFTDPRRGVTGIVSSSHDARRARGPTIGSKSTHTLTGESVRVLPARVLLGGDGKPEFFAECAADEAADAVCLPAGHLLEFVEGCAVGPPEQLDDGVFLWLPVRRPVLLGRARGRRRAVDILALFARIPVRLLFPFRLRPPILV